MQEVARERAARFLERVFLEVKRINNRIMEKNIKIINFKINKIFKMIKKHKISTGENQLNFNNLIFVY